MNKSLKESQENTNKQLEAMNKPLKESQDNTNKQLKEMNKTVQDLKIEIEAATTKQQTKLRESWKWKI